MFWLDILFCKNWRPVSLVCFSVELVVGQKKHCECILGEKPRTKLTTDMAQHGCMSWHYISHVFVVHVVMRET